MAVARFVHTVPQWAPERRRARAGPQEAPEPPVEGWSPPVDRLPLGLVLDAAIFLSERRLDSRVPLPDLRVELAACGVRRRDEVDAALLELERERLLDLYPAREGADHCEEGVRCRGRWMYYVCTRRVRMSG